MKKKSYQTGFGNHFESEALPGALPVGRNNPQQAPLGLYAEQLNGSAFTESRKLGQKVWMYRMQPSVSRKAYRSLSETPAFGAVAPIPSTPEALRWNPQPYPKTKTDFLSGLVAVAVSGCPLLRTGSNIHLYAINTGMKNRFFCDADGDFLILPQEGVLQVRTELGDLTVAPCEVAVVPRGIRFQVNPVGKTARGYALENFGPHFVLPERGPVGANGFANERDFMVPVAAFEDARGKFEIVTKFASHLWQYEQDHSPLDVVAWHGNYVPYKYDLRRFNTMGTVSYDHPDPSIFTVLTSPSALPGVANVDFVIFPERWMVAEDTFRPPYYHRNVMSEYMGLIEGVYDAKEDGFVPGGGSLHNVMTPHGPEADVFAKALNAKLEPVKQKNTLAFMFESSLLYQPTEFAMTGGLLQDDYLECWQGLKPALKRTKK